MTSSEINHNTIVIFTSIFPFGNGEPFLETEINYLAERFEKVIIVTQNIEDLKPRQVPANCEIKRIDLAVSGLEKIGALSGLFDSKFWKELNIIKSVYNKKLNKGIISTMLISLFRAKKIARYAKTLYRDNQQNSKLIFYSYWCDDIALGLAMFQKKYVEACTLSRIHRWDVYFEESKFNFLPFRHYITNNIGKIFSISQDGIDYAVKNWKTDNNEKFVLSRLGINNSLTYEVSKNETCLIVSCSNLIPVKRVHLIGEALQEIEDIKIKWVHFGDGLEKKSLEIQIKGLPGNVEVELKGRVPNTEIYTYYNKNRPDLFINVSSSEGLPVSIMEAMSYGIPCLGTAVGGTPEIINNENGYLLSVVPTFKEIAHSIESYSQLSDHEKGLKRKAAYSTWKTKYNAKKNYVKFTEEMLKL